MRDFIKPLLPFVGEYKESIVAKEIDEIKNPEFFDGYIKFRFDYIENTRGYHNPINGIDKTQKIKIIKTYSSCPFKNGDMIRIDGTETYKVDKVTLEVDDKYKKAIARYPNLWKIYAHKRIVLE